MLPKFLTQCLPSMLLSGLAITLTACSTALPKQYTQHTNILSTQEIQQQYQINETWWESFQDPQLNLLVNRVLQQNLDLKQSLINLKKTFYQIKQQTSSQPTIGNSFRASSEKTLGNHSSDWANHYAIGLNLNYEADLWGKIRNTNQAMESSYQASKQDLAATKLTIINTTINAYFHLSYLNEAIELVQQQITHQEQIAQATDFQYQYDQIAHIRSIQAKQSLLSLRDNLANLEDSRQQVQQTLRNLLNLKPDETLNINPTPLAHIADTQIDLSIPLSVLGNRPDIQAAEYRLQQAYQTQQAGKRSWLPSISLAGAINNNASQVTNLFSIPILGGNLSINLPFLNWPTLYWQNQHNEANFAIAKINFEKTLTTALNEVSNYYRQYQNNQQYLIHAQEKYLADSEHSRYQTARYDAGLVALSTRLEAENTVLNSAQNVLNKRYQLKASEALIYQSMAGRYTHLNTSDPTHNK